MASPPSPVIRMYMVTRRVASSIRIAFLHGNLALPNSPHVPLTLGVCMCVLRGLYTVSSARRISLVRTSVPQIA